MEQLLKHRAAVIVLTGLSMGMGIPHSLSASTPSESRIVLTSKEFSDQPEQRFTCRQNVFAYAYLSDNVPPGRHEIELTWIRPDGKVQDRALATVEQSPHQWAAAGFRLRFDLPDRAFSSGGSLLLPGGGGMPDIAGRWSVVMRCDGRKLLQSHFQLECPEVSG